MTITITPTGRKVKYLNNRDLLAEIHKSKCTYSSFILPEYKQQDIILTNLNKISNETIADAKKARAKRQGLEAFTLARINGDKKIKLGELMIDIEANMMVVFF